MVLRILILVCSVTLPAAKPAQREAVTAGEVSLISCKSSDVCQTEGDSQPLVGSCEDRLWSFPFRPDCDEDEDESEGDVQTSASAVPLVGGINLAISLFFPAHTCPLAAHFSSWCPPLRC